MIKMNRTLTLKDLNDFNTDRLTLVLSFLYFGVKRDLSIFDYELTTYRKIEDQLTFELVTNGQESFIGIRHAKGEIVLSQDNINLIEHKRWLNMMVSPQDTDLIDFV